MFCHFNTPIAYELPRERDVRTYKHDLSFACGVGSKNSRRDFRLAYKMGVIHQKAGYQETVTILAVLGWRGGVTAEDCPPPDVILGLYQSADVTGWTFFISFFRRLMMDGRYIYLYMVTSDF